MLLRKSRDTFGMSETPDSDLGALVLVRRRELGWSQERLAEEAGVSDATVRKIETGDAAHVQGAKLVAVREALGLPPVGGPQRTAFPADVELARDLLGLWLQAIPDGDRAATVARLTQWMYAQRPPSSLTDPE